VTVNLSTTLGGHLEYYKTHGITPVHYQTGDLGAHLGRRDSLYRSLGLPPAAFKGVSVLEVAPGTGQNSLYVAQCCPQSLDLVEPNPAGLAAIEKTYAIFQLPHTTPTIHALRLEEFVPERSFDIVLCENWLGALPHEIELIGRLASLVAPGGVLVLTFVPLSGFFSNVMRKLLALRIVPPKLGFDAQTRMLVEVFGPHLATIENMTRSHQDWVRDCLINPHYLNVALPLEKVLDVFDGRLEALATFPRFATDWRWFKAITGKNRKFNEMLINECRRNVHNFVDCRRVWPEREEDANASLDFAFHALHQAALAWQGAHMKGDGPTITKWTAEIGTLLETIGRGLATIDEELDAALIELIFVWNSSELTAPMIRNMRHFSSLFGRETVYLSLTRPITI
jgi:SAM-dependent methyltransferase